MDYSPMSIHFLWIVYAVIALAQVGYAAWLGIRWSRTKGQDR